MLHDHSHPELCPLSEHTVLGCDPEPPGHRFETLMSVDAQRVRRAIRPVVCPLPTALGNSSPCTGNACVFFRVQGVPAACAVQDWSPAVREDRRLASWYLARRIDAALAPDSGSAVERPVHTLASPGPGD